MTVPMQDADLLAILNDSSPMVRARLARLLFQHMQDGQLDDGRLRRAAAILEMQADDKDPAVRRSLARTLSRSSKAPSNALAKLILDKAEIAAPILSHSPLLHPNDLTYLIKRGNSAKQQAIAGRKILSAPICSLLIKTGSAEACAILAGNPGANIHKADLALLMERFGWSREIRENLRKRDNLPAIIVRELTEGVSDTLRRWMVDCNLAQPVRARNIVNRAIDSGTLHLAEDIGEAELKLFIAQLRERQQLSPALILRAACTGQMRFVELALAVLSRLPRRRIQAMIHDKSSHAVAALFKKIGMPARALPLFMTAVKTYSDLARETGRREGRDFHRRMLERVLTTFRTLSVDEADSLLTLLETFADDAQIGTGPQRQAA
jgi:uncharacterized protein (DUF2336 family)